MKKAMVLAAVAGVCCASAAWASDPVTAAKKAGGLPGKRAVMLPSIPEGPGFSDNFDSYAPGPLVPQGGWLYFDGLGNPFPASQNATVNSALSASAPNSLNSVLETDVVQVFNHTTGKWVCKVKTYVPSTATGTGYFIMMNTYAYPYVGGGNWSIQLDFVKASNIIRSNNLAAPAGPGTTTLPLVYDQWVEVVINIDLTADTFDVTYGGAPLVPPNPLNKWSFNVSAAAGVARIQCIDLYSNMVDFRWDDVSLQPVVGANCYANCDNSTNPPCLNVNDFICFNNAYGVNSPYANCDLSTNPPILNVNDFICFNNSYSVGCSNPCDPHP